MDKFKKLYDEFYEFSKSYLERSTNQLVGDKDPDSDLESLLTILPILERKIGCINSDLSCESVICAMQHTRYEMFMFWFLRSSANIKSLYNKILEGEEKEKFMALFKNLLLSVKTISAINNMYSNIKKDTNEIMCDFKTLLEIISKLKNSTNEQQAYKVLTENSSFITKTINKVLADNNYFIKIISLFNNDIVADKVKLEEYRDIFSFSKDNVIFGIRCFSNITIDGMGQVSNKYVQFFKRLLCNVIFFQASGVKTTQFVSVCSKLVSIIYSEIRINESVHVLFKEILISLKEKVSIEDIKRRGVNNFQGLIGEIANNREMYKNIFIEEYAKHKITIVAVLQNIMSDYVIRYNDDEIDVEFIFDFLQDNYISKL
ncbi:ORF-107 [Teiidae poxvirus 1]|nr:ORF-107 [Teiidae poxvirus 1]